jgi:hypothetical protein
MAGNWINVAENEDHQTHNSLVGKSTEQLAGILKHRVAHFGQHRLWLFDNRSPAVDLRRLVSMAAD